MKFAMYGLPTFASTRASLRNRRSSSASAAISGLSSLIATSGPPVDVARLPDLAHRADAELARELEAAELQPEAGPRGPRL